MTLILEITSPASPGGASRQTFDEGGGSLGRDTDNSWILPHPKVSAHHAVITCRGGVFYIEDRSTNGVFVNSRKNRLARNRPHALKSGDSLFIEPYEISVSIAGDSRDAGRFVELPDLYGAADPFSPDAIGSSAQSFSSGAVDSDTVDPLKLLGGQPKASPRHAPPKPRAEDLERASPLEEHFQPPAVMQDPALPAPSAMAIPEGYDPLAPDDGPPSGARPTPPRARPLQASPPTPPPLAPSMAIPANYNPLAPDEPTPVEDLPPAPDPEITIPPSRFVPPRFETPRPKAVDVPRPAEAPRAVEASRPVEVPPDIPTPSLPPPVTPPRISVPSPAGSGAAEFSDVLAGAGLDPANVTPEIAQTFGRIVRTVVAGLMDVLKARQQIKDEFRMQMTRFRQAENNPLKFSANVDDALHNLLVKRNPAYLPAAEAFEDAFTDLRNHQIAMLAGMRVAFESLLAEYEPERLQQEFNRQLNKGLVPAKLRYWELYREKYEEMVKDPETAFRRLFGDEFARAYEDQLRQLKADSGGKNASSRPPKRADP